MNQYNRYDMGIPAAEMNVAKQETLTSLLEQQNEQLAKVHALLTNIEGLASRIQGHVPASRIQGHVPPANEKGLLTDCGSGLFAAAHNNLDITKAAIGRLDEICQMLQAL